MVRFFCNLLNVSKRDSVERSEEFSFRDYLFWLYALSSLLLLVAGISIFYYRWNTTFLSNPYGDEGIFIASFERMLAEGWWASVSGGASPIFNLFGLIFYPFTENVLFSLRFESFFSMICLVFLWSWYYCKMAKPSYLQMVSTILLLSVLGLYRITFYTATNDSLMVLLISGGLIALLEASRLENKKVSTRLFGLVGVLTGLALGTRELFIYYLPGFLVLLLLAGLMRKGRAIRGFWKIIGGFVLVTISIHIPSLVERGKLSFQFKEPPGVNALWVERFYLTVMRLDGEIIMDESQRATWDDVLKYKQENGAGALPSTNVQAIVKDPLLTMKNFFEVGYYAQLPFLRQTGILYPLLFLGLCFAFLKRRLSVESFALFLFYVCFLVCFSITILDHVEFRWLMMFPFLVVVAAMVQCDKLFSGHQIYHLILNFNFMLLAALTIFKIGVW